MALAMRGVERVESNADVKVTYHASAKDEVLLQDMVQLEKSYIPPLFFTNQPDKLQAARKGLLLLRSSWNGFKASYYDYRPDYANWQAYFDDIEYAIQETGMRNVKRFTRMEDMLADPEVEAVVNCTDDPDHLATGPRQGEGDGPGTAVEVPDDLGARRAHLPAHVLEQHLFLPRAEFQVAVLGVPDPAFEITLARFGFGAEHVD